MYDSTTRSTLHANATGWDKTSLSKVQSAYPLYVKCNPVTYYAQLILCLVARYLNDARNLCYVRWLHTARAVAAAQRRTLTELLQVFFLNLPGNALSVFFVC